jgi:23S rRNA (adenine2030-N6)-methyltransferase
MLAYRHAFHAGNHADVLKHIVLLRVLAHMNLKDKGYRFVDTHAGAGGYSLEGDYAKKKGEFETGIARLWSRDDLPPAVADYVALVREFNGGAKALKQYPGSPTLAQSLTRPQDNLRLFELHPTEHRILASYMEGDARVEVKMADGFDALKHQLPPPTRRGIVLIDPSYEGDRDYPRVLATVREALARFADGTYMVWYPQITKLAAAQLPKRLQSLAPKGWLHARLTVGKTDAQGFGLMGSGVFIFNPPFTLHAQLNELLPWLHGALAPQDGSGGWLLDQRAV